MIESFASKNTELASESMSLKKKAKKPSGLGNFFSGIKSVFSKGVSKGSPKELVKESAVPIL